MLKWNENEQSWVEIYKALNEWGLESFENLLTASQYWIVYEKFTQILPSGSSVLDWGCGEGHFSYFLLNNEYKVNAYSLKPVEELHWKGCSVLKKFETQFSSSFSFKEAECDDPVELPYPDETFDAVASIGVLEHVRQAGGDELKSLLEIRRVLKPGGLFLCFHFPNQFSWIDALARQIPGKLFHPYRYTQNDIEALNLSADLKLVESGSYGALPRNTLTKLPKTIKNRMECVKVFNQLDQILQSVFRRYVQNHYFISRKSC
jgi:ubiquinone/menaquinone biosynthesis C-methylase UbiE